MIKNYIILPDVHRPFHNQKLWDKILNLIKDVQPYGLVITGDYLDLYSLASYNDNSLQKLKDITLEDEYKDGLRGLQELESSHSFEDKVFIFGNHEDRFSRFLQKSDNYKIYGSLKTPIEALQLEKSGYNIVKDWKRGYYELGKLQVFHGYYTNQYAARKHMDEYLTNCMFGHTHRLQVHATKKFISYNIGWLGDINAHAFAYTDRGMKEKWVNAFAIVNVLENGQFWVELVQSHNDSFMYGGKFY